MFGIHQPAEHCPEDDPVPKSPEDDLAFKSLQVDLLKQILKVLQNFNIAEESGQDAHSNFWAKYKKVSLQYDHDMLEGCYSNMNILPVFAGLLSAVDAAFIIAMQPNPVDTTNALLEQLINISLNGSSTQPSTLSAPTGYSSTTVWAQAFAYTSLAFSLIAAFGAMLGLQWLDYYKSNAYGLGPLEAQCKQRQCKFDALQRWQFHIVLQSFPVFLQLSLLLFGLSLGTAMWTQQPVISSIIFSVTAFGSHFYIFSMVAAVISPDCPFQTPTSLSIQAIIRYFSPGAGSQPPDSEGSTLSALRWILEVTTNPDVIRSTVELMPIVSKPPDVVIALWCERVRDIFKACFGDWDVIQRDSVLTCGHVLVQFAWQYPEARCILNQSMQEWDKWDSWRDVYLPWELERIVVSYGRMMEIEGQDLRQHHQADIRSALRMAVATGIDEFTEPDDERLVLDGKFQPPYYHRMDINRLINALMGCITHFHMIFDPAVAGDALLLAGGLTTLLPHGRDRDILRRCYIPHLSMVSGRRWYCITIRVACQFLDHRKDLLNDEIFLRIVLTAVFPPIDVDSIIQNAGDEDDDQFTKAIRLLTCTKWPEGHHLRVFPLLEIQRLVHHSLRVLPTLAVTVDIRDEYTARWRDALTAEKSEKYTDCWRDTLTRMMGTDNVSTVRSDALHAACEAMQDLDLIAAAEYDESQRSKILSELSLALLTAADANLADYLRLIFALAKSPEWRQRFVTDGHVEKCITLENLGTLNKNHLYLAGFFLRIASPWQEASCCSCITDEQWWMLMKTTWYSTDGYFFQSPDDDTTDIILNLVKGTETYIPRDLSQDDLKSFSKCLGEILDRLEDEEVATVVSAVKGVKGMVDSRLDAT